MAWVSKLLFVLNRRIQIALIAADRFYPLCLMHISVVKLWRRCNFFHICCFSSLQKLMLESQLLGRNMILGRSSIPILFCTDLSFLLSQLLSSLLEIENWDSQRAVDMLEQFFILMTLHTVTETRTTLRIPEIRPTVLENTELRSLTFCPIFRMCQTITTIFANTKWVATLKYESIERSMLKWFI